MFFLQSGEDVQERRLFEKEERRSFWRVCGGERGRMERVESGVRVLRWGCGKG